jgi:hypothetical protein
MPESRNTLPESEAKRPAARLTIRGVIAAVVLGLAGFVMLAQILYAVLFGQFVFLAVCVVGVGLVWLLTRRVRVVSRRIFLRAFAFAAFLWPFIPHGSVEWSSLWPPAGFWVFVGLNSGSVPVFEIVSILVATSVMWLAGCAVYRDRHRNTA